MGKSTLREQERYLYARENQTFRRSTEWKQIRKRVLDEANGVCHYCKQTENIVFVDHVIPRIRGGADTIENLVACCGSCSAKKNSSTPLEWARREAIVYAARRAIEQEFGLECAETVKIIVPRSLVKEF